MINTKNNSLEEPQSYNPAAGKLYSDQNKKPSNSNARTTKFLNQTAGGPANRKKIVISKDKVQYGGNSNLFSPQGGVA